MHLNHKYIYYLKKISHCIDLKLEQSLKILIQSQPDDFCVNISIFFLYEQAIRWNQTIRIFETNVLWQNSPAFSEII